jgi:anti-sigma regulatory factor (Ser/Thr protein kinase)
MITRDKLLELARQNNKIFVSPLAVQSGVSRQYLNRLINELVRAGKLIKVGETRYAYYVLPEYARKHPDILPTQYIRTFSNASLEEHIVLSRIEQEYSPLKKLPENIRSIFTYAFSEMFNNAIEHSQSKTIRIEVAIQNKTLSFIVEDYGIGVFRNVMRERNLKSELEAIQDLLKGKTTTMPKSHSGEGIFFTSRAGDLFILDSYGYQLSVDNILHDVFIEKVKNVKRVTYKLNTSSSLHLNDIFKQYTNTGAGKDYGFDKTEVRIKLYTMAGVHISRSQARRVLAGLDKFKVIVFDFDKVSVVGQAFADEIFRVFHHKYSDIKLETENMNESVNFMVGRARAEAEVEKGQALFPDRAG